MGVTLSQGTLSQTLVSEENKISVLIDREYNAFKSIGFDFLYQMPH